MTALRLGAICVGLLLLAAAGAAESPPRSFSQQTLVDLDVGESHVFPLGSGTRKTLRLLSVREQRDSIFGRVRQAEIRVAIDDREIALSCAPYVMPTVVDGLRIQADTTDGFLPRLPKRVQFSLWDAAVPIVDTARFVFPLDDYEWLSQGMQTFDEVCWLGDPDDQSLRSQYHNYGIDFAGHEGGDTVRSPVGGVVLGTWNERPAEWDRGSVVIVGEDGLWWELAHLDRLVPGIVAGTPIAAGDSLGWLGARGPSGRVPHLHVGTYFATGSVRWNVNRRLNLYPWFLTAYEARYRKNLYAVAGGHQLARVGETLEFDGVNSLSFDSAIAAYRWEFDDGVSLAGRAVTHAFALPGVHSAALWVEDRAGRRDVAFCEIRVFPPGDPAPLPRLKLTCHPSAGPAVGTPVRFRLWMQSAGAAAKPAPVLVDFGDDTAPLQVQPPAEFTHAYATAGLRVVTARVTDDRTSTVRQIKVVVAPPKS